jgi:hypothetical protein
MMTMVRSKSTRLAMMIALAGVIAAPASVAHAQRPDGKIEFTGGEVAFILGVHWGGGTLIFHGRRYSLKVGGLKLGSIGGSSYKAVGEVYNLHNVKDIEGTYGAANVSATAGAGSGAIDMTNGNGVEIRARSSHAGLQLTLAAAGVDIRLK